MSSKKDHKREVKPMRSQTGEPQMDNASMRPINLQCLNTEDAAKYLEIPPELLRSLKSANLIPFVQLKHKARIMYPVAGLEQWLKNNRPHSVGKIGGIHE
jgi:hypothetical protein